MRVKPLADKSDGEQQLHLSLRVQGENAIEDGLSPQLALQISIEADSCIDLVVKDSLINPAPLVVKGCQFGADVTITGITSCIQNN